MKNINPKEFLSLREEKDLKIIDIREFEEVRELPFESTINIPLNLLLSKHEEYLNKRDDYYLVCHHGQRSAFLTNILEELGYKVVNVVGGVDLVNRYKAL